MNLNFAPDTPMRERLARYLAADEREFIDGNPDAMVFNVLPSGLIDDTKKVPAWVLFVDRAAAILDFIASNAPEAGGDQ